LKKKTSTTDPEQDIQSGGKAKVTFRAFRHDSSHAAGFREAKQDKYSIIMAEHIDYPVKMARKFFFFLRVGMDRHGIMTLHGDTG